MYKKIQLISFKPLPGSHVRCGNPSRVKFDSRLCILKCWFKPVTVYKFIEVWMVIYRLSHVILTNLSRSLQLWAYPINLTPTNVGKKFCPLLWSKEVLFGFSCCQNQGGKTFLFCRMSSLFQAFDILMKGIFFYRSRFIKKFHRKLHWNKASCSLPSKLNC